MGMIGIGREMEKLKGMVREDKEREPTSVYLIILDHGSWGSK